MVPVGDHSYRFKVAAGLLRLNRLKLPDMLRLLSGKECQGILRDLVGPMKIIPPEETLALITISEIPSARIFLMRLAMYTAHNPKSEHFPLLKLVPWEEWQYSLGLIALFNDHESLLYKLLLSILKAEARHAKPILISSVQLYMDLIYRAQYDPHQIVKCLLENHHALEYYTLFYRLVKEDLLFNAATLYQSESSGSLRLFHRELESRLPRDQLGPLQLLLEQLLDDR
jgi:hypothetical protein